MNDALGREHPHGRPLRRLALRWGALLRLILLLTACGAVAPSPVAQPLAETATPCLARLWVESTPAEADVYLDEALWGATPLEVEVRAGAHVLRVARDGWETATEALTLGCAERRTVALALRDAAPPLIKLSPLPPQVGSAEGLKVVAAATDASGVAAMRLFVNGVLLAESAEGSLRHNVDTRHLAPGEHVLTIRAADAVGNESEVAAAFAVLAPPTAVPASTSTPTLTPLPSATPTLTPSPTPLPVAPTPTIAPVTVVWGEITLDSYAYEQALYTDPDGAGHPYPLLRHDQVGAPRPRLFQTIVMRNEYLELTLLPELGGRIFSARFLPTGQELLFQNRTLKPTHWGPLDQGWWLAAGGMEWCLPVDEHGYVSAEPWEPSLIRHGDGSATVAMSIQERSRNLLATVEITLKPREAAIYLRPSVRNPDGEPKSLQFWINAMLSPGRHGVGPSLRFYYPTSQVLVHSRGDPSLPGANSLMPWPLVDGRDLSRYANWRDWLGFFALDLQAPYTAVYDEEAQLGLVRTFPPALARGVKLFAFGLGFGDNAAYSDDGAQYAEMWGGWTSSFWEYGSLAPYSELAWDEVWYPLSRCGGVTQATAQVALYGRRDAEGALITVAAPGERRWTLSVTQGERELARQEFAVRPDAPFEQRLALPAGNSPAPLDVRIVDFRGEVIAAVTF